MSVKQPAFQFYPADWRKDPGVQSLSLNDRGAWFEMLCLMHESPRRGVLLLPSGEPMTEQQLARILGISCDKMKLILTRISTSGVSSRDEISGAISCRRMVRDEKLSETRSQCGKQGAGFGYLGGRPKDPDLAGGKINGKAKKHEGQNNPPSSSSSSSDKNINNSSNTHLAKPKNSATAVATGPKYSDYFLWFWDHSTRRGSKVDAFAVWSRLRADTNPKLIRAINAGMEAWRLSDQWQEETKQTHIHRWLNRRGWEEIVPNGNGHHPKHVHGPQCRDFGFCPEASP